MHIYLVRHPPPSNVEGLCYGRQEVAVDELARLSTAESVTAQIPTQALKEGLIYCSPSSRCLGLARHIASPREPIVAEDLLEMNFGQWQGLTWDRIPRQQIDAWMQDIWGYRPGDGESADMVAIRWHRWLEEVRQIDSASVVAVTHAGVIRVALARSGKFSGTAALEAAVPFGSVHRLDIA